MTVFTWLARLSNVVSILVAIAVLWKSKDLAKEGSKQQIPWRLAMVTLFSLWALRWVSLMVIEPDQARASNGLWASFYIVAIWLSYYAECRRMAKAGAS